MALLTLPSRPFVTRDSDQFALGFIGRKNFLFPTRDLSPRDCKCRKQYHLYSEAESMKTYTIDQLLGYHRQVPPSRPWQASEWLYV